MKKFITIILLFTSASLLCSCQIVQEANKEIQQLEEAIQRYGEMFNTMYIIILAQFGLWIFIGLCKFVKNSYRDDRAEDIKKKIETLNTKLETILATNNTNIDNINLQK